MSTRGAIARVKGDGWEGVYQHFDSYPTGLGKKIWEQLHNGYNMDIEKFLAEAIDQHQGGWSSYPDSCYCHHWEGRENDPPMVLTDRECDPLSIEWVYALNPRTKTMAIFAKTTTPTLREGQNGTFIEGTLTRPSYYYIHTLVTVVRLTATEPDWESIEEGK